MRHSLQFLLLLALATSTIFGARTPNGFEINRGVNISHWLSQVPDEPFPHHDIMYTELDAAFIAAAGFDHIRLPIDEERLWTEDGEPIEERFAQLRRGIEVSLRHDLRVVVDLHIVRSHYFNAVNNEGGPANTLFEDPEAKETFLDLWRELSSRLGAFPIDSVAYEILNEAVAEDPADWNNLLADAHAVIRGMEPERTIVMGSNNWQTAENFPVLEVPEGDPNIILSFHTYTPMLITHLEASWVPTRDYDGPVQYPGVSVDEAYAQQNYPTEVVEAVREMGGFEFYSRDTIEKELLTAIRRAEELGLPLYCGEFGSLETPGREIRLRYYRDLVSIFQQYGIAYANWDYRGSFRILDPVTLEADHELIRILTGQVLD